MADQIFPTGFSRLASPTLNFTVFGDNGSAGGYLLLSDILGLMPLSTRLAFASGNLDLAQNGATTGQALVWSGTTWAPGTVSGGTTPITIVTIDGSTITGTTGNPYQMVVADRVVIVNKTTGAATKLLLPTSPTLGVEYRIIDGKRDAGTNNITIAAANGTTINGAATFVANANADAISLLAVNATTWLLT